MEKVIYLIWGKGDASTGDGVRDRLLEDVVPAMREAGVRFVTVNVHDGVADEVPSPAPVPADEDPHIAEVSVWFDCYERRLGVDGLISSLGRAWAAYLVVESVYEDYGTTPHAGPRTWPDGERSPGVMTLALIHRPEGLDYREWIERWHGTQSPESGRLQPRTRYVRNEVVRSLTPGAPEIDGIVEECWPSAGHVKDPMLFFNASSPEQLNDHVGQMITNVQACLDLGRLRSSTMSEYLVAPLD